MVLQTHLQCQIISISPATKYKHRSTTILILTVTSKCMMYYSMVFKLNDTVPDVQDDHPLQNISSDWYYKHILSAK